MCFNVTLSKLKGDYTSSKARPRSGRACAFNVTRDKLIYGIRQAQRRGREAAECVLSTVHYRQGQMGLDNLKGPRPQSGRVRFQRHTRQQAQVGLDKLKGEAAKQSSSTFSSPYTVQADMYHLPASSYRSHGLLSCRIAQVCFQTVAGSRGVRLGKAMPPGRCESGAVGAREVSGLLVLYNNQA